MNARDWARVKRLFDEALSRPGARRPTLRGESAVPQPSGEDSGEATRAALDLLAVDRSATADFERQHVPRPALLDEQPGWPDDGLVDGYRLTSLLGQGGMSTVYRAERADGLFHRPVALKVIRRDLLQIDGKHRFDQERRILAGLDHPHIARLLDGGATRAGWPYLVMELVDGLPVDAYCDRHQLRTGDRLRLFLAICEAVSHAHRNLVVHRDIKPSNILITGSGQPKLLDFGIAKLLNPSLTPDQLLETSPETARLTLAYASPEQMRREPISTAIDVYALGVLLYELLTGRRPYRLHGHGPEDAAQIICHLEPPPPSEAVAGETARSSGLPAAGCQAPPDAIRRRGRRDLDAIVLRACAKSPRARYPSADDLASDVRRYLAHRPARARRPHQLARAAAWAGRHRFLSAIALLLVITACALGVQTRRLRDALAESRSQEALAESERAQAVAVSELLLEVFEVSDPASGRGSIISARELLEIGSSRIARQGNLHPATRASLTEAIGRMYLQLGLYEQAGSLLERALAIRRAEPSSDAAAVAESLAHLAFLRSKQGLPEQAVPLAEEALALRRSALGEEHPDSADSLHELGEIQQALGHHGAAEELYSLALSIRRRALGDRDPAVAESLAEIGVLRAERQDYRGAEAPIREALEILRTTLGPEHPKVGRVLEYLSRSLAGQGDLTAARAVLLEAERLQLKVLGEQHPDLILTYSGLAEVVHGQGDLDAAALWYQRALDIQRQTASRGHPMTGSILNGLALVLSDRGSLDEALTLLREAQDIYRESFGPTHPAIAVTAINRARVLQKLGRLAAAEENFRAAVEIQRTHAPQLRQALGITLFELGRVLNQRSEAQRARPVLEEAVELLRGCDGSGAMWAAVAASELGASHLALGSQDRAERLLRDSERVLSRGGEAWRHRAEKARARLALAERGG